MPLETLVGKAVIEVDYLTHAGPERAEDAFNKWIKTAKQWSIGVTITLPPTFLPKPKEEDNGQTEG